MEKQSNLFFEKIKKMENFYNKPELLLTDFSEDAFLNKSFFFEKLKDLDIFKDCELSLSGQNRLSIYFCTDDFQYLNMLSEKKTMVLRVNLENKHIQLFSDKVDSIKSEMERKYVLKTVELPDFWKDYENFSFKSRFPLFLKFWKKHGIRHFYGNVLFILFIPKHVIKKSLEENIKKVEEKNENLKNIYNSNIAEQEKYLKFGPTFIEAFYQKQNELIQYFEEKGYVVYD